MKKKLILGTALWGYSVEQDTAFNLLDSFYKRGFRWLDTATNYPIDKNPEHFRLAERILAQWLKDRKVEDLKIIAKIGSLSNDGGSQNDLSPNFIRHCQVYYHDLLGNNLNSLWVHWDNRDSSEEIRATLSTLAEILLHPGIGLSGIRHPLLYADLAQQMDLHFRTQIKHNILLSTLPHYRSLADRASFYAYGLNAGGLTLDKSLSEKNSVKLRQINPAILDPLRPQIETVILESQKSGGFELQTFNQLSMTYAYGTPEIEGLIIGPSKLPQLEESMDFFERLEAGGFQNTYARILDLLPASVK